MADNIVKRYSAADLVEFKELLEEKLTTAKDDLSEITKAITNDSDNDTNDTSPTFKNFEEGFEVLSKQENSQLAGRLHKYIGNLEAALRRIDNGTYGICKDTGKLISKERLRCVPHATQCIEAKLNRK